MKNVRKMKNEGAQRVVGAKTQKKWGPRGRARRAGGPKFRVCVFFGPVANFVLSSLSGGLLSFHFFLKKKIFQFIYLFIYLFNNF